MLIIGHRGSAGTKPENTIASLREAIRVGADVVEFDIRITKDKHAVLAHDFHMIHSHRRLDYIRRHTLKELQKRSAGSDRPTVTVDQAIKECFGKTIINIEVKEQAAVTPLLRAVMPYMKKESDWEMILFSAFNPLILRRIRKHAPDASLSLLHYRNPLLFMAWHRSLQFSAVGFHRLHLSRFGTSVAKELGLFTYTYTVNRLDAAHKLAERGIDGIVTDFPEQMIKELQTPKTKKR